MAGAAGVGIVSVIRAVGVGYWRCDRGSRCGVLAVRQGQ